MNARAKQLLDEVLELPPEEREAFAAKILASLDEEQDARTDEEWEAEISRRAAEAQAPEWRGKTWAEVRAEVTQGLRPSRGG